MPETKPCLWCKQSIDVAAYRCQHCRSWQRPGADSEEVRKAQILDDGVVFFGKFILGGLAVIATITLGVVGYDIRSAGRESASAQAEAAAAQSKAETSQAIAEVAASKAGFIVDQINRSAEDGRKKLAEAIANAENAGTALKALEDRVAKLEQMSSTVALATPQQVKAQPLSQDEIASIEKSLQIVQTATPVSGDEAAGTRRSYNVTFAVCIRILDQCDTERLNKISRVIYRLQPQWFSVADIPVVRAADAFSYTVQVWGRTRVRACVFLLGAPDRPLVRAGTMQLTEASAIWGPGSAGPTDSCEGVRSY